MQYCALNLKIKQGFAVRAGETLNPFDLLDR
jgi:hypothetical protein